MSDLRQATPLHVSDSAELRYLPEGPYPIAESRFSWVAIQHGAEAARGSLNRFRLDDGTNESFELPGRPGFAFPCRSDNTFIVGCERSLGLFNTQTAAWEVLREGIDQDVDNTIINDGTVFEDNLIFGTKDLAFAEKKAGLYLWRHRDGALIRLRDDQICSNGKAIRVESDGSPRLIDIDSPTRQIVSYRLDVDGGKLGDPQLLIDLTDDPAVPDGAILTPDGAGLIVSMFLPEPAEYGQTRLYDLATGQRICTWQTPGSPQNTCPALVRHDGGLKLVITTAAEHMNAETLRACPNAGEIFLGEIDLQDPGGPLAPVFPL